MSVDQKETERLANKFGPTILVPNKPQEKDTDPKGDGNDIPRTIAPQVNRQLDHRMHLGRYEGRRSLPPMEPRLHEAYKPKRPLLKRINGFLQKELRAFQDQLRREKDPVVVKVSGDEMDREHKWLQDHPIAFRSKGRRPSVMLLIKS